MLNVCYTEAAFLGVCWCGKEGWSFVVVFDGECYCFNYECLLKNDGVLII